MRCFQTEEEKRKEADKFYSLQLFISSGHIHIIFLQCDENIALPGLCSAPGTFDSTAPDLICPRHFFTNMFVTGVHCFLIKPMGLSFALHVE